MNGSFTNATGLGWGVSSSGIFYWKYYISEILSEGNMPNVCFSYVLAKNTNLDSDSTIGNKVSETPLLLHIESYEESK